VSSLINNDLILGVKKPFRRFYVDIGKCVGENDQIWTLAMNTESKNTPIILMHGFGAGMAFWTMNLEELAENNPVYAIDTLGFARSSRPNFSYDPEVIEKQFVDSIEQWREKMGIESMILCCHSFGGFLASSYTLRHPKRVDHLILVDGWGLNDFNPGPLALHKTGKLWKISIAYAVRLMVGPFSVLRAFGPFGEWLVTSMRSDLLQKYQSIVDPSIFGKYVYHCNNNWNPSGEAAFHRMTVVGPWPVHPIGDRMTDIAANIPITLLYGESSWVDNQYGAVIKQNRPNSYCKVSIVPSAGHHIYTDNSHEFNRLVLEASKILAKRSSS